MGGVQRSASERGEAGEGGGREREVRQSTIEEGWSEEREERKRRESSEVRI
jgi:hypothetical protein